MPTLLFITFHISFYPCSIHPLWPDPNFARWLVQTFHIFFIPAVFTLYGLIQILRDGWSKLSTFLFIPAIFTLYGLIQILRDGWSNGKLHHKYPLHAKYKDYYWLISQPPGLSLIHLFIAFKREWHSTIQFLTLLFRQPLCQPNVLFLLAIGPKHVQLSSIPIMVK